MIMATIGALRLDSFLSISAKYLTGRALVKSAALHFCEIFNGAGGWTQINKLGASPRLRQKLRSQKIPCIFIQL